MNHFIFILTLLSTHLHAAPTVTQPHNDVSIFKARLSSDAGSLDWGHGEVSQLVVQQIMRGLTHSTNNNVTEPALATHWIYKNSNRSNNVTFYLRKDARWSDGTPLCAQHFIDAWNRALSPAVSSPYAHYFDFIDGAKKFRTNPVSNNTLHVSTKNCHELTIQLAQPGQLAHHILSHWVFFPARIDLIKKYGKEAFTAKYLTTTGPYTLQSWTPDQKYTLVQNPHYYGSRPKIPHVEFLVVPDDNTALNLFKTGIIHWMKDLPYQDIKSLKKEAGFSSSLSAVSYFLGFNSKIAPFDNAAVRCGISHALDTNEIPAILTGLETPAFHQLVPIALKRARRIAPKMSAKDSAASQNIMNEAKNILADFVNEGGSLPKIEFYNKDIHVPLMAWVQSQLQKKLGTRFELLINDGKSYWQKLEKAPPGLFLSGTTAWFHHPYAFLSEFLSTAVANWGKYSSKEYDLKVHQTLFASNTTQRNIIVHEAEDLILNKDCAVIPLYFRRTAELLSSKCRTLHLSALSTLDVSRVTCSK